MKSISIKIVSQSRQIIHQHLLLSINLCLLLSSLVIGFALYAGKLHQAHDDIGLLSPVAFSSEWDFFSMFFMERGQIGTVLLVLPWRFLVRVFQPSPETFPWWLFSSLNLFCVVTAPLIMLAAGWRLSKPNKNGMLFFLLMVVGCWVISPTAYSTTIFLPVSFFAAYTLPLYLLSLGMWFFSDSAWGKRWKDFIVLGLLYLAISLSTTTFTLSVPIVFIGISLLKSIFHVDSLARLTRSVATWCALTLLVVIFIKVTPGYQVRTERLGVESPGLQRVILGWYRPIPFGYTTFPLMMEDDGSVKPWHKTVPYGYTIRSTYSADLAFVILHGILLAVLFSGLAVTLWAYIKSRQKFRLEAQIKLRNLLGLEVLALIYIVAFHASVSTFFFTPYFPDYTKAYPSLLVVFGWIYSLWAFVQASDSVVWDSLIATLLSTPDSFDVKHNLAGADLQTKVLLAFLALSIIFVFITLPNTIRVINIYKNEIWINNQRYKTRHKIIDLYLGDKKSKFLLSPCPQLFDSYWAYSPFFSWQGYPEIQVVMEGAYNYGPAMLEDPSWVKLPCTEERR